MLRLGIDENLLTAPAIVSTSTGLTTPIAPATSLVAAIEIQQAERKNAHKPCIYGVKWMAERVGFVPVE